VPTQISEISLPCTDFTPLDVTRNAPACRCILDKVDHSFFDDRRFAGRDQFEFGLINVDTDDVMPVAREASKPNSTDVSSPKI